MWTKIWGIVALSALGVSLLAQPAAAQMKVAVFDAQEVITNTNAAKRAVGTLTSRRDGAQQKIDALEKPLVEKQKQIRSQQAVMSPEKLQEAQAAFAKDLAKFRASAQEIQSDLDRENLKLRKDITDAVRQVVSQLATEQKLDMVLPKGAVFYSSAQVPDLTAEVLKRTNALLDK
jgi:outer membrane protein